MKPREESLSQNMAVMSGRYYRGEGGSPGNSPQPLNQSLIGKKI